jgi:transcription termination factor Rho
LAGTISAFAEEISERVTVLVDKATPVVRAGAARASELVAQAGEAAGPAAHRAAVATADLGEKVAAKGRDIAADLRHRNASADSAAPAEAAPAEAAEAAAEPVAPVAPVAPAEPPVAAPDPMEDHPAG